MNTGLPLCINFIRISFAGYESEGKHHVELTYDPMHFNAVACSESHIFVADSAPGGGVHIHSWRGQHTQSLSHGQLGLQDYDWIWAINCFSYDVVDDDDDDDDDYYYYTCVLQLAVGDYGSEAVHSLHACEASDFQAEIALGYYIKLEDSISTLHSFICIYLHNYLIGRFHTSKQVVIDYSLFR